MATTIKNEGKMIRFTIEQAIRCIQKSQVVEVKVLRGLIVQVQTTKEEIHLRPDDVEGFQTATELADAIIAMLKEGPESGSGCNCDALIPFLKEIVERQTAQFEIQNRTQSLIDSISKTLVETASHTSKQLESIIEKMTAGGSGSGEKLLEEIKSINEKFSGLYDVVVRNGEFIGEYIKSDTEKTEGFNNKLDEVLKVVSNVSSKFEALSNAIQELNISGKITQENLSEIRAAIEQVQELLRETIKRIDETHQP